MALRRVLVALRDGSDLPTLVTFLRGIEQRPKLIVAALDFRNLTKQNVVKFEKAISKEGFESSLTGFDFEFVSLPYVADTMPSSAFVKEAQKRKCDLIMVVSSGPRDVFSSDLASTLAADSSIPVLVVRS
jgi:nucleotide-binding universal stress UspA family protein